MQPYSWKVPLLLTPELSNTVTQRRLKNVPPAQDNSVHRYGRRKELCDKKREKTFEYSHPPKLHCRWFPDRRLKGEVDSPINAMLKW